MGCLVNKWPSISLLKSLGKKHISIESFFHDSSNNSPTLVNGFKSNKVDTKRSNSMLEKSTVFDTASKFHLMKSRHWSASPRCPDARVNWNLRYKTAKVTSLAHMTVNLKSWYCKVGSNIKVTKDTNI